MQVRDIPVMKSNNILTRLMNSHRWIMKCPCVCLQMSHHPQCWTFYKYNNFVWCLVPWINHLPSVCRSSSWQIYLVWKFEYITIVIIDIHITTKYLAPTISYDRRLITSRYSKWLRKSHEISWHLLRCSETMGYTFVPVDLWDDFEKVTHQRQ